MESDQASETSQVISSINFEDLHGNMNLENNNRSNDSTDDLKKGENVLNRKNELTNGSETELKEPEKIEIQENEAEIEEQEPEREESTEISGEETGKDGIKEEEDENHLEETENEKENTENEQERPVEDIAKEIIDKAMTGATNIIKEEKEKADTTEEKQEPTEDKVDTKEADKTEDEWLDILGNGLLKKKILIKGAGESSRPKREQEVAVTYKATLDDGTVVESKNNLAFVVSDQDVVDALDLSVNLMEKGEKAIVKSDSRYAYGEEGKPPKIPPKSNLTYEIELTDVSDGPYSKAWSIEKRLEWADKKRQRGNEQYSKKDYTNAAHAYTKCLKVLESAWFEDHAEETKKQINGIRLKCYNNLAASEMKLEKWKEALRASTAAEKLEPENVKALFRKGKILIMMGELDKGTAALTKANQQEPDNKVIALELAKQKRRLEQQKEAQKKMYRRMMGTKDSEKKPDAKTKSSWVPTMSKVVAGTLALGAVLLGIYIAHK